MALNGELQGWIRTVVLGIGIGVAYGDLRYQSSEVRDNLLGLRMEFRQVAERQAENLPMFKRLMADFDALQKEVRELQRTLWGNGR